MPARPPRPIPRPMTVYACSACGERHAANVWWTTPREFQQLSEQDRRLDQKCPRTGELVRAELSWEEATA
jgi:NMD protein affecting ribosome stability and mRNA decay